MIYVYRTKASTGARQLAEALDGKRIRQQANIERITRPGDTVVCWGEAFTKPGVTVLNGGPFRSKFADIEALSAAGIRTVSAARSRPMIGGPAPADPFIRTAADFRQALDDFLAAEWQRGDVFRASLLDVQQRAGSMLNVQNAPAPVAGPPLPDPNWFGRSNHHVGGLDLLNPPSAPDYWVKKESITDEYRLHVFDGRSIRAGKKAPRTGAGVPAVNPWIRSFDGGWKIVYDRYESTAAQRTLAAAAVSALGLTFGAVDLGLLADGSLIILEVNRAPGLEGGTIEAYARAIERWEEQQERRAA